MYVQTGGEDIGKMKNTRGVLKNVYFTVQDEERERKRKREESQNVSLLFRTEEQIFRKYATL